MIFMTDGKTTEKKKQEVLIFFKYAFHVDGDVKIVDKERFKVETVIELNDSKRGKFFIGMLKRGD